MGVVVGVVIGVAPVRGRAWRRTGLGVFGGSSVARASETIPRRIPRSRAQEHGWRNHPGHPGGWHGVCSFTTPRMTPSGISKMTTTNSPAGTYVPPGGPLTALRGTRITATPPSSRRDTCPPRWARLAERAAINNTDLTERPNPCNTASSP